MKKPKILILCTGNSCRSHMAESILRKSAGDAMEVYSAGSNPAGYVHPRAIEVMREIGVDLSGHESKHLNGFLEAGIDTVITVCDHANEACPVFPGKVNRHHWAFDDPAKVEGTETHILNEFRRVRDEIRKTFEAYAGGFQDCCGLKGGFS